MIKSHPFIFKLVVLFLLTAICYGNTLKNEYNLDDNLVKDNLPPVESGITGTFDVFTQSYNIIDYRPVGVFTFALEQWVQGDINPVTSHAINVVLYFFCALLLFLFISRLPIQNADTIALIATMLFIIHPIHSNVVSSLKNRENILSLSLSLISLLFVIKFLSYSHEKWFRIVLVRSMLIILATGVMLAATFAKQDAATLIFIIPLTIVVFFNFKPWLNIFGIGLGYGMYKLFTYIRYDIINPKFTNLEFAQSAISFTENPMVTDYTLLQYEDQSLTDSLSNLLPNNLIIPNPADTLELGFAQLLTLFNNISLTEISAGLISLFYYLKFHIVPTGYYYYFGYDMITLDKLFIWQNILSGLIAFISLIGFFYFLRRRPIISLGIGIFFAGLSYALNIYVPVAGIVAPRHGFIASVGFCIVLAALIVELSPVIGERIKRKNWTSLRISYTITLIIILIYAPFTISRNADWKNIITLIEADIQHMDRSFEGQRIACLNYLDFSKNSKNDQDGFNYLSKSLYHGQLASQIYDNNQFVEESIGYAYFVLQNHAESYKQSKKVLSKFKYSEMALEILGEQFSMANLPDSAAYYYKNLAEIAPDYYKGYVNYNHAMEKAGKVDEAIMQNIRFMKNNPDSYFPYEGLGYLYLLKGDTALATQFIFYAMDKGSPNEQFLDAMSLYFKDNDLVHEWGVLMDGNRMHLGDIMDLVD